MLSKQEGCIFCRIITGELDAKIVHRDEHLIAFADLYPQAPVHLLLVPLKHIPTLHDHTGNDPKLYGHLLTIAAMLATKYEIANSGYRLVINTNAMAGQTVPHLHLHLLGGRALTWPPG